MKVEFLDWTQKVVDKIWQKHQLTSEEVEEAIWNDKPLFKRIGSNLYSVFSQSLSGRYLFIVLKRLNRNTEYKVITAREMQPKEKRYYRNYK